MPFLSNKVFEMQLAASLLTPPLCFPGSLGLAACCPSSSCTQGSGHSARVIVPYTELFNSGVWGGGEGGPRALCDSSMLMSSPQFASSSLGCHRQPSDCLALDADSPCRCPPPAQFTCAMPELCGSRYLSVAYSVQCGPGTRLGLKSLLRS